MQPENKLLDIQDLEVVLRTGGHENKLIEDVSFGLGPGESLGIVGESGSGKTITALSILGLLPPGMRISGGQILLGPAGETGPVNLTDLGEKELQNVRGRVISMIFQEPMTSLNPTMRCGDQVLEAAKLHTSLPSGTFRDLVYGLFNEVRLPAGREFYGKYPHQLSGGQRQRVMIAMALAGNPSLLIADEPTTALDVTVQKTILDLLQDIREKRQMSMIFISHDLGVIRMVCDKAMVMYKGRIVESGEVKELFRNPGHPYTRGLIACRPDETSPERLPTLVDFMADKPEAGEKAIASRQKANPDLAGSVTGSNETGTGSNATGTDSNATGTDSTPDPEINEAVRPDKEPSLLSVTGLRVEYALKKNILGKQVKSLSAVDDVSFEIRKGETLGLIGESGCGKSTLGRSIIRLIRSGEGSISFRGQDVGSLKGKDLSRFRRKVQFIFQDPYASLNPRINAGASIMEVLRVHGISGNRRERRKHTMDLLDRVGLEAVHFDRYPHEFSGGQRQRIGIARALATEPELIICDESVSSLDVSVQAMILNLLNELKESHGLTYLFISHDLSVVRYMSDRIMVMKDGKMVETGTGESLFTGPASDYTRSLIDSIPE